MEKTGSTLILKRSFKDRLDEEALNSLRAVAQRRTYPPGTVLFRQGERGHTFYVVVKGRVAVVQTLEDGEERILGMTGAGEYFGEMALIDDTPRMATVTAVQETTVLEITEAVFDRLVEQNPSVAHAITRRIVQHARNLDQRAIQDLEAKNVALQKAYADLKAAQAKIVEKERLERELELAADVQRNLLPGELPQFPNYRFAAYLQPARHVGGDFYDVVELDDEHVGMVIADVADKGFHASLFMAVTRTLFLQEGKHSLSPAKVATAVHQGMLDVARSADVFVTAVYGVLHRPSGVLTYVRAGHERPLHLRADGTVTALPGNGRFLGMWPELSLPELTVPLRSGDRLVLFSDGVPDAVNHADAHYDTERLEALLRRCPHLSASELVQAIVQDVNRWSGETPAFDDLTLLVLAVQ